MSNYIDEIFARMNVRQTVSFLLCGADTDIDSRPLKQQLSESIEPVYQRLHDTFPNENEFEEVMEDLEKAFAAHERVYTEIGMKAGARVVSQLLVENDGINQ